MKLHLGCGDNYKEGYINVDLYSTTADIKCNLDDILPWNANTVDEIMCIHTLEHCKDVIFTVNEMIRVCKCGAKIIIEVPHFRHEGAIEASHYKMFGEHFFNYWDIPEKEYHKYYPRTGFLKLLTINQKPTIIGKLLIFDKLRSLVANVFGVPTIFSLTYILEVIK